MKKILILFLGLVLASGCMESKLYNSYTKANIKQQVESAIINSIEYQGGKSLDCIQTLNTECSTCYTFNCEFKKDAIIYKVSVKTDVNGIQEPIFEKR